MEGINAFFQSDRFPAFYEEKLKPVLEEIDHIKNVQIPKLKKKRRLWQLIAIVPFIGAIGLFLISPILAAGIPAFFLIRIWGLGADINKKKVRIRSLYKFRVIKACLHEAYDEFQYIAHQRFGTKSIYRSLFFEDYIMEVKGEDFMRFFYKDIMLQFSEIKITCDGKEPLFLGIFLSVDFHKKFKTSCVLKTEETIRIKHKKHKPFPPEGEAHKVLHLTKLEESKFEKLFRVYSEDPVETRYILSPSTMTKLVDYKEKINMPVEFSFVDSRMYVKIKNYTDLFEPSYKEDNNNIEKIKKNLMFISELTDIIKDINLDTSIWKA